MSCLSAAKVHKGRLFKIWTVVLLTNFCVKQPFITGRDTQKASGPHLNMALLTTKQKSTLRSYPSLE